MEIYIAKPPPILFWLISLYSVLVIKWVRVDHCTMYLVLKSISMNMEIAEYLQVGVTGQKIYLSFSYTHSVWKPILFRIFDWIQLINVKMLRRGLLAFRVICVNMKQLLRCIINEFIGNFSFKFFSTFHRRIVCTVTEKV